MREPQSTSPPPRTAPRRRPRRWVPWLGALLLFGLVAAGLWPKPIPVETGRATVGNLRCTIQEEGKTRVRHRFVVSAPVTGQLRRIELKPGAAAVAGQTELAVIDPLSPALLDARTRTLAEAKRDAAAAQWEKARAAAVFARNELERFQRLYQEKTVTIQELEAAQWREAAAANDEAAAQSALRQAEAELAEFGIGPGASTNRVQTPTTVWAPASGRVLRVLEESARVVAAGTPLIELGDPTDLEVVIEMLSRDGAAVEPGARVELEEWGGPEPLAAQVRVVEPSAFTKVSALGVEEQRVRVIADLLTPPAQRPSLGDHFRVEARVITWESASTLKVPAGALVRRGSDWVAYVVVEGRARMRTVKAGRSNGLETQVLEGLTAGEEVILYPGARVQDGRRIRRIEI